MEAIVPVVNAPLIVCEPPVVVGPPVFELVDVKFEVDKAFTLNVALFVGEDATSIVIQK